MSRFSRRKIALALACASVLGGKTQAMNSNMSQSKQALAAVGEATSSKFNKLTKKQKIAIGLGVGLGVISIGAISTIIALAIKGKNSNINNGNPPKVKNATDELENKAKIQQKDKKGEFYEKNQKMIEGGIAELNDESQGWYNDIKELILNYKDQNLSKHIEKIYDPTSNCIKNSENITPEHQKKYIGLLDGFIDIYSGRKELTEFSTEKDCYDLFVKVYSKDIHYDIYQNEVKVQKVNENDKVIFSMSINVDGFITYI